ncbi:hypothetical protein V8E53_012748 [Lactarius tabidus]
MGLLGTKAGSFGEHACMGRSGLRPLRVHIGAFRTDYELILGRVMCSHQTYQCLCTAVAWVNDAEALNGMLGALSFHEFLFGRSRVGGRPPKSLIDSSPDHVQSRDEPVNAETLSSPAPSSESNRNSLLTGVTNLNADLSTNLTALHAALPTLLLSQVTPMPGRLSSI